MSDRNAILETLAIRFENYRLGKDGFTSSEAAAAVLELVGPKPLVWVEDRERDFVIFNATCQATKTNYTAGTDRNGDSYWYCSTLTRHQEIDSGGWEAAQAAAQAHADAAHWANTKIGGE